MQRAGIDLLHVETVLQDVIRRRHSGEVLPDDAVLAEHPDVAGALAKRLTKLRVVEQALRPAVGSSGSSAGSRSSRAEVTFTPPFIAERYDVLREINHGGQAMVYLARDRATQRNVAVKVLRSGALADDRERHRFEREADILSQLDHPNIVAVLDRGRTRDGLLFLVMNYVPGEPLSAEAMEHKPLAERLSLFVATCRAVQAAHARGVVHRDLKPSNIRIDDRGAPHVLDFGLAVSSESLHASMTVTGQFLGTFLWASPEQAAGRGDATPASDVYSLGVILHQIATGGAFPRQVFDVVRRAIERTDARGGRNGRASHGRIRGTTSHLDNEVRVPGGLSQVIDTCLAEEPRDRYTDAGALADAVERYLANPLPPRSRLVARRALVAATALAVGSAGVLGGLWALRSLGDPPHRRPTVDPVAGRRARIDLLVPPQGAIALAWIPPGQAVLGTELSAHPKIADEAPHRAVFRHGFYLSRSEVTRAEWENVMGSLPPELQGASAADAAAPVTYVSYHDAIEFCRRVSARTGRRVRLPTEDEWEYAARAEMTGAYPDFINAARHEWPLLPRYANFADRSSGLTAADRRYDDGAATLSAVGRYIGNEWTLADVIGNVWEWTGEPYRHELTGESGAPAGGLAADPLHVSTRGGSWRDDPLTFRFGNRNPLPADFRGDNVGFRILVEGEAPAEPATSNP